MHLWPNWIMIVVGNIWLGTSTALNPLWTNADLIQLEPKEQKINAMKIQNVLSIKCIWMCHQQTVSRLLRPQWVHSIPPRWVGTCQHSQHASEWYYIPWIFPSQALEKVENTQIFEAWNNYVFDDIQIFLLYQIWLSQMFHWKQWSVWYKTKFGSHNFGYQNW